MIEQYSVAPYTFILQHLNFIEYVLYDTKGVLPMIKIGDKYYVNDSHHYQFFLLNYFSDGLIYPRGLAKSMEVLSLLMKHPDLPKQYPLFTRYYKTGYAVIINGTEYGPIDVVTTSNKYLVWLGKRLHKQLNFIPNKEK